MTCSWRCRRLDPKAPRQHLVHLLEDKGQQVIDPEALLADHIIDTPGSNNDKVLAVPELVDVVTDRGAADTCVALDCPVWRLTVL